MVVVVVVVVVVVFNIILEKFGWGGKRMDRSSSPATPSYE